MSETLKRHTRNLHAAFAPNERRKTDPFTSLEPERGHSNLTALELVALRGLNVADGHPRQRPSPSQVAIINRLPEVFETTRSVDFFDLECSAARAYLNLLSQTSAPVLEGCFATAYSSSILIDVVGRALKDAGINVIGLVHPTFDNIPDLLRSRSHGLVAISEDNLTNLSLPPVECLFITSPNNPTGWVLEQSAYEAVAQFAASRGIVVVHDASFRGFDVRAQFDCYAILEAAGGDYVVIEDTGKLWPMQELKVGFSCFRDGIHRELRIGEHLSDVLLTVSPVILRLVELLALDAANSTLRGLHELVAANRSLLSTVLGSRVVDADSRISVARVRTTAHSQAVYQALVQEGVHVLPCGPLYWANRTEGSHFVRVALARDPHMFAEAARRIAAFFDGDNQTEGVQRN
jgi:histidinol-phosphate/aromatic aminotransferase/cobyric acid decarboxylase-like protein